METDKTPSSPEGPLLFRGDGYAFAQIPTEATAPITAKETQKRTHLKFLDGDTKM